MGAGRLPGPMRRRGRGGSHLRAVGHHLGAPPPRSPTGCPGCRPATCTATPTRWPPTARASAYVERHRGARGTSWPHRPSTSSRFASAWRRRTARPRGSGPARARVRRCSCSSAAWRPRRASTFCWTPGARGTRPRRPVGVAPAPRRLEDKITKTGLDRPVTEVRCRLPAPRPVRRRRCPGAALRGHRNFPGAVGIGCERGHAPADTRQRRHQHPPGPGGPRPHRLVFPAGDAGASPDASAGSQLTSRAAEEMAVRGRTAAPGAGSGG